MDTIEQDVGLPHTDILPLKSQCLRNLYLSQDYLHLHHTTGLGLCLRPGSGPMLNLEIDHENTLDTLELL